MREILACSEKTKNNMNANALHHSQNAQQASKPKITDEKQRAKLQKAVQDFEALFVNYMLKTMRKSIHKDEESESDFGGEMMQEMFDFEMAKHISRKSGLGIGEMLYRQITGESLPATMVQDEIAQATAPIRRYAGNKQKSSTSLHVKKEVNKFEEIINDAAEKHGVDSTLLKAMMATESAGNPNARSSANAKGLMQLIDSTAVSMGVENVWDPEQNIHGGAKYIKQLLEKFNGDIKLALASYNAGPARVEKHKGIPPIPETQQYVRTVLRYMDVFTSDKE